MNNITKFKNSIGQLQDDILDEYNKGNISREEMSKIMQWTQKNIEIRKKPK
jgi:hypothetical protein